MFYRLVCEEYMRLTGIPEDNWINVIRHWDKTLRKDEGASSSSSAYCPCGA